MDYRNSKEVAFTLLSGGGIEFYASLMDKIRFDFGDFGGEEISGRANYVGGGASHRGTGTLAILHFSVEYNSDDDLKAIEGNIKKALETEHSGVL